MEPILVVGGGLGGLAAALALPGPVVLVDPREPEPNARDLRSTAILQPGRALLEELGVWRRIGAPTPLRVLRIGDLDADRWTEFDSADLEGGGPFGWNVPNAELREALLSAIAARGDIDLRYGTALAALTPRTTEALARLSDGTRLRAQLAVGADGRESAVRRACRIGVHEWRSGQSALSFVVRHGMPHDCVSTEIYRSGGPFVLVPLADPHLSAVVWMERTGEAERLSALPGPALAASASERSAMVLGPLSLERAPVLFPLVTRLARRLSGPSCVLMAEAAHAVPPIGAQGLNMTLGDVAALRGAIADGTGPAGYERARRLDVSARVAAVTALGVAALGGPVSAPRGLAIGLLDRMPALRRPLMRFGLGGA